MSNFAYAVAGGEWSIPVLDNETPSRLDAATIDGLRQLGESDPDFLADLIDSFRADTEARLAELDRASLERDLFAICTLAHVLSGSSSNFGAVELIRACRAIEHLAKSGYRGGFADAACAVRRAYGRALPLLEALV
jgi:HPt (histidine-containing phosphotransfer) domain-containing protein